MQKINSLQEYNEQYAKSVSDPEEFWNEKAETFQWKKKWDKTLEWEFETPDIKWFLGGKLNITNFLRIDNSGFLSFVYQSNKLIGFCCK